MCPNDHGHQIQRSHSQILDDIKNHGGVIRSEDCNDKRGEGREGRGRGKGEGEGEGGGEGLLE
jgi:hypothetical protein